MKKAQLKHLKQLIKSLPEIPLLHEGKADTIPVMSFITGAKMIEQGIKRDVKGQPIVPELFYTTSTEKPKTVNKEKFFIECCSKGMTPQQTIDLWNDRYKKVQETIANYKEPEKPKETVEEMKQRVADIEEKRIAEEDKAYKRAVSKRQLAFPRTRRKK